jgi:metal-sulfur cluster biosynthetic enzyme/ribosomal protein L22
MTPTAELRIDEPQVRVTEGDARTALRVVAGRPVVAARARLRFGPGRTCEPIARLLDRAIVQAEGSGLDPGLLLVAAGSVHAAEDIVRVRRKAYGIADWIHSPACRVQIVLRPAGLSAAASTALLPPAEGRVPVRPPADVPADSADERVIAVREVLSNVIDPDLGVNIVDLGFVRAVAIDRTTAVITMTLTSAACPLTDVMENQIHTQLAALDCIEDIRIDWQWIPAWRPADISDDGREQLRAIGFTIESEL